MEGVGFHTATCDQDNLKQPVLRVVLRVMCQATMRKQAGCSTIPWSLFQDSDFHFSFELVFHGQGVDECTRRERPSWLTGTVFWATEISKTETRTWGIHSLGPEWRKSHGQIISEQCSRCWGHIRTTWQARRETPKPPVNLCRLLGRKLASEVGQGSLSLSLSDSRWQSVTSDPSGLIWLLGL